MQTQTRHTFTYNLVRIIMDHGAVMLLLSVHYNDPVQKTNSKTFYVTANE